MPEKKSELFYPKEELKEMVSRKLNAGEEIDSFVLSRFGARVVLK